MSGGLMIHPHKNIMSLKIKTASFLVDLTVTNINILI